MEGLNNYIDYLLKGSTPNRPLWDMEKVRENKDSSWNYINGCMIKAVLEMYEITKEKKFLDFADNFVSYYVNDDGSIKTYSLEEYNIDNINMGKVLFNLYHLTNKEKYRKAIDNIYNQLKTHPRTNEKNFWHKKIYPYQVWLDGLYMAQPFYVEYETKYNNCKNYDDIYNQFKNVEKYLKDRNTGLYYHGYDESREMYWANKETGCSQNFWLRALGWYYMAIVDTLEKIEDKQLDIYEYLSSLLLDLTKSLVKYQDKSGMFYQLVDKGNIKGNYLESSGSLILAYGMLKATRLKIIPEEYKTNGLKSFNGTIDKYFSYDNDQISLDGICLVAGLGGNTRRDGSVEYYFSEPIVKDDAKGVAPLFLAYTEVIRLNLKR